jgi:hypothetical protein
MKYSLAKLDDINVDSSVEVEIVDAGLLVLLYILANRSRERLVSCNGSQHDD